MQTDKPLVSIIIINYNQKEVTHSCLMSLRNITYPNVEIFLVDNNSQADQQLDQDSYPEVRFIYSKTNLGFAGGNNLAMKLAGGKMILLLNNDTEVPIAFLEPLVDTLTMHMDAGMVSPKIIFYDAPGLIQYAGTSSISPLTGRGKTKGFGEHDQGQYDHVTNTSLAHGACMLIKRDVMDKIGLMDEDYFLYYEEYDYCETAKQAGFTIYFNGTSHIVHKQSVSVGRLSPLKSYYMSRNRLLFSIKHFNGWQRVLSLLFFICIALPKKMLLEYLSGRSNNSIAALQGVMDVWRKRSRPLYR